jgi:hypothetical protein
MMMPRDDLPFCECNWFERAALDPHCPVEFDPDLNEYNLKTTNKGSMRMYHCPFCSGRAPESFRGQRFATVASEETIRLHRLTRNFRTEDEVRAALGEPTVEFDPGLISQEKSSEEEAPVINSYKTLRYDQYSDTVSIFVKVNRNGTVSIHYTGKHIGKPTGV